MVDILENWIEIINLNKKANVDYTFAVHTGIHVNIHDNDPYVCGEHVIKYVYRFSIKSDSRGYLTLAWSP